MSKKTINPEEIWALQKETNKTLKELSKSQKETDKLQKETDKLQKETAELQKETAELQKETTEHQKETDKKIKELSEQVKKTTITVEKNNQEMRKNNEDVKRSLKNLGKTLGGLENSWGKLGENLIKGNLAKRLKERGIKIEQVVENMKNQLAEFDIVAINGKEIIVVEVKSQLKVKDVEKFLSRIKQFKTMWPVVNQREKGLRSCGFYG